MSLTGSGLSDSGIDRALRLALDKELDTQLATGELFDGERARFPEPMPEVEVNRPWQFPIGEKRTSPSAPSLGSTMSSALGRQQTAEPAAANDRIRRTLPPVEGPPAADYARALAEANATRPEKQRDFVWRPERTGIVVVHGIGPQLAGQTLLDWTRPIIQLLRDAPAADPGLVVPLATAGAVRDPVIKSNIDFSGETFPVIQVG